LIGFDFLAPPDLRFSEHRGNKPIKLTPANYDRPDSEQRALGSDQSLRLTERHLHIRNDAPDQRWTPI
jgi:hypothetical protein